MAACFVFSSNSVNSNSHFGFFAQASTSTSTTNRLEVVVDSTRNLRPILNMARFIPTPNCPTECLTDGAPGGRPNRKAYLRAVSTEMPPQLSETENSSAEI